MIEVTIIEYLNEALDVPVWMEIPKGTEDPDEYVLIQKTGSGKTNLISHATFALQSYGGSLYKALSLNEDVKTAMDNFITLDEISASRLNSDYNFTDTTSKKYRYQAVYDITYKEV